MALKALMLGKRLADKKKELDEIRENFKTFEVREKEIETAINEATTDEERNAVEEAAEKYDSEKTEAEEQIRNLEKEISDLENELEEIERATPTPATPETFKETRKERTTMIKRFKEMNYDERCMFVQRDEVQAFLKEIRTAMTEKRAITNAGYLIPDVIIGLLKENIEDYSKLYGRVFYKSVPGTARVNIQGVIPEAVWTEACANLNELDLGFTDVEVDGYKVGGYFKICNASLEDSDVDLFSELISVLGQSIGYALDKAILYGTGTKMPVGIVTALAAVTDTPNIVSHANTVTGANLVKAIINDSSKAKGKYSRGAKTWVMNETTYNTLIAEFTAVDGTGAYVSRINGVMPVVGGDVVVLDMMPDNTIIGGYMDLYLLAERKGTTIGTSEHAFWTADQTGFKGSARYDGKVLINNAFVAIGINGVTPAANQVTFASDTANL